MPTSWKKKRTVFLMVAVLGLISFGVWRVVRTRLAVPTEQAQMNSILGNLRFIESAKDQWALERKKHAGDLAEKEDLFPFLKNNQLPVPVVGEMVNINPVGTAANAKIPVKLGTYPAGSTITIP
jgi:hypothetical protein